MPQAFGGRQVLASTDYSLNSDFPDNMCWQTALCQRCATVGHQWQLLAQQWLAGVLQQEPICLCGDYT